MVWGIFKSDAVSETYKKMKAEELKGNQHKLDVDKDGKIEGEDLAKLRAQKEKENSMKYGKDVKESAENVEEGWDDMVKYAKEKNAPQPNGGAGKKQGTRYGGSKQKDEKEVKEDVEQIDEISKKTLGSYVSKASVDMANRTADATKKKTLAGADYAHNISRGMDAKTADKHMKKDYDDAKPDVNKAVKRMHNINKAVNRLTKEDVQEEVEQIDELSKGTLASYAKKATHDSRIQQRIAKDFEAQSNKVRRPDMKRAADVLRKHYQAKAHKREAGVGSAVDRLAKESYTEEDLDALINEVLSKDASAGEWISDFVKSDNPKFAGKSSEKRKDMALAAYYAAQKKESTDYESFIELDEEADLVKSGSKEIKHANIKDKEDDKDDFGPRAQGERDFLDQLSVNVTDDPAKDGVNTGASKVARASEPKGQGAGKYDGKNKTGIKEGTGEESSSEASIEEASCDSESKAKGKKTFSSFKKEMKS